VEKPRFRIIEHTADIGLVAYGSSLAEAFASAAYGLFSIIAELDNVREKEARTVDIREDGAEALLFEWLNQLIYIFNVESLLFRRFEITEFNRRRLRASCRGEKYDPARHRLKTDVKAATYHLLEVAEKKNRVQVIFDI